MQCYVKLIENKAKGFNMRLYLLAFIICLSLCNSILADDVTPPVINYNVHVIKNTNPSQCPSSWNGSISPETITNESQYGTSYGTAIGVQSCTGCAFDNQSGDCVCNTCYGYYN